MSDQIKLKKMDTCMFDAIIQDSVSNQTSLVQLFKYKILYQSYLVLKYKNFLLSLNALYFHIIKKKKTFQLIKIIFLVKLLLILPALSMSLKSLANFQFLIRMILILIQVIVTFVK